jgi:hypothetical protein
LDVLNIDSSHRWCAKAMNMICLFLRKTNLFDDITTRIS